MNQLELHMPSIVATKDFLSGLLFMALGLFVAGTAFATLDLGTQGRIGPGAFPLLLGSILFVLGAVVLLKSVSRSSLPVSGVHLRSLVAVLSSPLIFGLTIDRLGLLPTSFLAAFAATLASKPFKPLPALLIAAGITLFSVVIFHLVLNIPTPLIGLNPLGG
jgi:hypothetical protein